MYFKKTSSYKSFIKSKYLSLKYKNYFYIYDKLFHKYKNKNITFVEIGVFSGGSLFMWNACICIILVYTLVLKKLKNFRVCKPKKITSGTFCQTLNGKHKKAYKTIIQFLPYLSIFFVGTS